MLKTDLVSMFEAAAVPVLHSTEVQAGTDWYYGYATIGYGGP